MKTLNALTFRCGAWLVATCFLYVSCTTQKGFQGFYNQHKRSTSLALAIPTYVVKIAIPQDSRKEIIPYLKGMRKVRFLYDAPDPNSELNMAFNNFLKSQDLTSYISTKKDGQIVEIWARKNNNMIHELILRFYVEDDATVIVALMGKVRKDQIQNLLKQE